MGDGNSWLTGGTGSFDFPVTGDAADTTINGGSRCVHLSAERRRVNAVLLDLSGAERSRRAAVDSAFDSTGDVYIAGHTFSVGLSDDGRRVRHRFQWRPEHLLGRCVRHQAGRRCERSTPPSTPPPPRRPALSRRSTTRSCAAVTFDWGEAAGAVSYTIQIDDRARSPRRSSAIRALTGSMYRDQRPRRRSALLARARGEHRRRRRRVVGGADVTPGAPPPLPVLSTF